MLRTLTNPEQLAVDMFNGKPLRVGLIDADLLDGGTRCPNLALLKIAGYLTAHGHNVRLICSYSELDADLFSKGADDFDALICSQVFKFTTRPATLQKLIEDGKCFYGGTGFFEINAPRLPDEVEHACPLYTLYDEYISKQPGTEAEKAKKYKVYKQFSIGFTTRGCFRQCPFCVNRTYKRVAEHSPIAEFVDPSRPYIFLYDDNFMAAPRKLFFSTLEALNATGKRFQFRQGLDIRLMTDEKAKALAESRYYGDYIFAFDHIDAPTVKATLHGLETWRRHCNKSTKIYVLVAFDSVDESDVASMFWRIRECMRFNCLPYIMRFEKYKGARWKMLYTAVARWCNQPALFKKKSFLEFCAMPANKTLRIHEEFAAAFPAIAAEYYDMKLEHFTQHA